MTKVPAVICLLLILCPYAAADGMIFVEDRDMWILQPEENQLAAINYEEGMENLLLAVSPGGNLNGTRAVWIFPIPAAPERISIDILKGFPRLTGENRANAYNSAIRISALGKVAYATFPVCIVAGGPAALLSAAVFGMAGSLGIPSEGLEIHERVDKMGVTTEVVTAKNADALQEYLVTLGMDTSQDERVLLQDYIGRDYSFVVSYISDLQKFRQESEKIAAYRDPYSGSVYANVIGVFVRFPVDRIFYPLRPTAAYGSLRVPVLLYVTGYTTPQLYDSIRQDTSVIYFMQRHFDTGESLAGFFNGKGFIENLKYTKIRIDTPASRFSEDLWIDPVPPADVAWKELYLQASAGIAVITYIIFSMIASLAAGMLVFRKKAADRKVLLLHGLWNCLTFIGLALATRKKFPQAEYGKRGPYVLAFYLVFAGLVTALAIVLSPDLVLPAALIWIIGLLAPLFSLGLLLLIPQFLSSIFYVDMPGKFIGIIACIVILIIALCPIPALIWIRRWLDPVQTEPA